MTIEMVVGSAVVSVLAILWMLLRYFGEIDYDE